MKAKDPNKINSIFDVFSSSSQISEIVGKCLNIASDQQKVELPKLKFKSLIINRTSVKPSYALKDFSVFKTANLQSS